MVVVVYDISDDKRRNRLAHFLEGYGQRVQLSVFECHINLKEMRQLYQKVKGKIEPDDRVRFYWISPEAINLVLTLGSNPPEPPPTSYII